MPLFHTPELIIQRRPIAELLAYTVSQLFPDIILLGGGTSPLGFYYDFIFDQPVHADMLAFIELHLRTLIKENRDVRLLNMMRENAQALFLHHGQPFLAEKAGEEASNIIDLIQIDQFHGLCPAFSMQSTGEAGSVKLLDATEKKWLTEDGEVTVTRLLGTSFDNPQTLKQFLKTYDAYLKKKSHVLIGQEMDFFSLSEQISPVEWIWHPKGESAKQILQEWMEKEQSKQWAIEKVSTPLVVNAALFAHDLQSFPAFEVGDQVLRLSASRVPQHVHLFQRHSVLSEELPVCFSEFSAVYKRKEEGINEGMLESACELSDQLTIFCLAEQLSQELISSLHFIEQIIRIFGFEAQWYLVASRQKSFKAKQERKALDWIKQAIQSYSFTYPIDSHLYEDDNNIEGPRLELRLVDEIGRQWAGPSLTIIIDRLKAWNFKAEGLEEKRDQPVILKRQIWGSLNRFIALLIERFEGALPLWLAPEQVRILSIGESVRSYAKTIEARCKQQGLRVRLDLRPVKLGEKIHEAEKERIPYLLIVGDQECKKQGVTVRSHRQPGKNQLQNLETCLEQIQQECVYPALVEYTLKRSK
ncbi:His/Gly/Thr/Pro-type tRNA ligase C-terminal domain-containing protein [Candidatus Protochlamydia phocaeensis]|uniref:His/Gly/Thr/Pro-type tRNA ligase C-terminal domain-containing protein n=1 Tax=Candidatus Protochlamydia phocaeensis TaxID=1414722 RepID=UPI000837CE12|nr:His/Gly/Thr/Pro-type tRNA ligase C-terminal domain-containing protein [Candidatus Protochlamydia phocaeensis]